MGNTKEMYSWWWDSHISPKNSKWLLDNLTDMDSKVITMIKIIEVDEDSFARRAEMYYEKRPELMKLLEEIYRAYRALAERYDHATGVIRQAHKTMAEAFPNQVPFLLTDDGPVNDTHDSDRCTPEMHAPIQALFEFDESKKGSVGLSSSHLFEKGETVIGDHNGETQILSQTDRLGRPETDVQALKEALSRLEAEKEAGLIQYKETLDRLSKLESEVLQAKEDSKGLNGRAGEAEARVQSLKETLEKVEAEREASLHEYRECLERISTLESSISHAKEDAEHLEERASKAERESEIVKEELLRVKAEKDALLSKYMEALEKIANLENKLLLAEDYASQTSERADRAEKLVESLKVTIARLTEEKEAAVLNHEKCLAKIATLECEIIVIQERAERLKVAVEDGNAKLKGSEEQCLVLERSNKSLHSEVEWLEQKLGTQNQELAEKQRELGRLWTCLQEERMRFMETEASFKSLQNMHSKVQEELRFVASDLHKKVQLLKDLENQKLRLEDEVEKVKDEKKSLSDINLSSEVSIRSMEEQIVDLKEAKGNLEQELNRHLDQKNDLQQEIHSLKEELSSLSARHQDLTRQVESLGFNFKSFDSSVIELRFENSKYRENFQRSEIELADVKEKLTVMEKLIERNELLEKSLSNLNDELEAARRRVKDLEGSFQLLLGEKSTLVAEKGFLISQLRIATENIEKLSDHNTFLENSLLDANAELDMLRMKCMNLEDSCMLLDDHTSDLIMEKRTLKSKLETTHSKLEELEKKHTDLEQRFTGLEEERESTLCLVQELQLYLDIEKQEHANSNSLSQNRVADLEKKIHLLQEAGDHMREEFEEELDKAVNAQLEIFILKKCIHDLNEKNYSLLKYSEKLLEASRLSEKLISELEIHSIDKQDEVRMLSSEVQGLRKGMFRLLEALEASEEVVGNDYGKDQRIVNLAIGKLDEIKISLHKSWDENHELVIEKSVFLAMVWQLKHDVLELNAIIRTLEEEVKSRNGEVIILQKEIQKLLESNEELLLKLREGSQKEVILFAEMDGLREKLFHLQEAYGDLQEQNCKVIEEKRCLMKDFEDLKEEKHYLEDECSCMVGEVVSLDNLSFIFNRIIFEKSKKVMELTRNINKLRNDNNILEEKARTMERNLEESRNKNVNYGLLLKKTEDELEEVRVANDKLNDEIANGSSLLCLKEKELQDAETMNEYKEKEVLELSRNYSGKLKECEDLRELIKNLESQILMMQKDHEESEARIQVLSSELQEGKDEARLWESVAGVFFTELQSCSVREALIKEKFSELLKAYEKLEEESRSKCEDIIQLKERVGTLEGENSEVKARLAADFSAIMSLKDSLASLEKHASWPQKILKNDNEEKEDIKSIENSSEVQKILFLNLQKIQTKIQDVEKAVIELKQAKQQAEDQNSRVNAELDSALRQIKLLKSQSNSRRGSGRLSGRAVSHPEERKPQKNYPGISHREDKLLMKDIVLDQISDASSYGKNKRVTGSDDQIFELWENIDQAGSIDLTVNKPSRSPPLESIAEKELTVDDQQLNSKRFQNPELEDKKRKTLERLASDVQKLTNLQITVQALKEKLEMTENSSSKGKDVDCDGVKDQLLEIESTILKLFEYSSKIMKNIEKSSGASSFDGSVTENSPEGGGGRSRRYLEQARRISEKIGRLQLDVQKLQFLLMKLNNNVGKGGTRVTTERTTQVLLRDYLNSGLRTPRRRKRASFCGCVKPRTRGD